MNDSQVGRDLYRTRVLTPGDVTLVFSVRLTPFLTITEFFSTLWRGVNISTITSSIPIIWSLRHYPRFFRYTVLLSSGEVVLCADPGPSNLGIIFVLSLYHFERSCSALSGHFRLLWTLL